jgi:endonuclease YncB( thermonuclease family)
MNRLILPTLLSIAAFVSTAIAGPITGRVVSVADGDTITMLTAEKVQVKIRLAAIDAPESGQEFGQKSRQALASMVAGKTVQVTEDGKDRYQRVIGWVRTGDLDANREMVKQGWAWHFVQYSKDPGIGRLQAEAKAARRGIWAAPNPPMPPWEFRALKRGGTSVAKPATETPVPALGGFWINSNGVRHNAGCRWFGNTKRGHYGTKDEGKACGICGG